MVSNIQRLLGLQRERQGLRSCAFPRRFLSVNLVKRSAGAARKRGQPPQRRVAIPTLAHSMRLVAAVFFPGARGRGGGGVAVAAQHTALKRIPGVELAGEVCSQPPGLSEDGGMWCVFVK